VSYKSAFDEVLDESTSVSVSCDVVHYDTEEDSAPAVSKRSPPSAWDEAVSPPSAWDDAASPPSVLYHEVHVMNGSGSSGEAQVTDEETASGGRAAAVGEAVQEAVEKGSLCPADWERSFMSGAEYTPRGDEDDDAQYFYQG